MDKKEKKLIKQIRRDLIYYGQDTSDLTDEQVKEGVENFFSHTLAEKKSLQEIADLLGGLSEKIKAHRISFPKYPK